MTIKRSIRLTVAAKILGISRDTLRSIAHGPDWPGRAPFRYSDTAKSPDYLIEADVARYQAKRLEQAERTR